MEGVRVCEVTGGTTIIAPARAAVAPADGLSGLPVIETRCPFCPGNEADTEIALLEVPPGPAWRVRSVANRYPMVQTSGGVLGRHEVLVETRAHDGDLPDYSLDALTEVLTCYRDRAAALGREPWAKSVAVFRNRGRRAGSSQPHPHGQIVALALVGPEVARRTERSLDRIARTGVGTVERAVAEAIEGGSRIVASSARFVAFVPYAPRYRYEIWIAERSPRGRFEGVDDVRGLAEMVSQSTRMQRRATGGADYNVVVRDPPLHVDGEWYVEIAPRRSAGAGFELTTGVSVLSGSPEDCAAELRGA